jgi:hypothetical protein
MSYLSVAINGVQISARVIQITEQFQGYTSNAKIIAQYPAGGPFPSQFDSVVISDNNSVGVFAGYVSVVTLDDPQKRSAYQVTVSLTVRNLKVLTDATLITKTYTPTPDHSMIIDGFLNFGPSSIVINAAYIASIMSLSASFSYNTLTQFMDQICQATGGGWYIDGAKNLHYVNPIISQTPAPFGLSDAPDNVTTFPYIGGASYSGTFTSPINDLTLFGGINAKNGVPIKVTSQNAGSISTYGVHFYGVVQDNTITDLGQAQATADAYVAANGIPKKTLAVTIFQHGLSVGQVINFTKTAYGFSAVPMVIQGITTTLTYNTDLSYGIQYDLALGDYMPSFANTFRKTSTSITNPVFNPVIPYAPEVFSTYHFTFNCSGATATNVTHPGSYWQGDVVPPPTAIINLTNIGGKLLNVSMLMQSELFAQYDSGPGNLGSRPISVWLGINIDGQGEVPFTFINAQTPAASGSGPVTFSVRGIWSPLLNSLMTPGINTGVATIVPQPAAGSSFGMTLGLEFVNSLVINLYWKVPGFTVPVNPGTSFVVTSSNSSNFSGVENATAIDITTFYAQRYPG